jgi:hypothetical protein
LSTQSDRRKVRAAVHARDRGCVLQVVRPHACFGGPTVHHLKKASRGGSYTLGNLVELCAWANCTWVETHVDEATALGLLVPSWEPERLPPWLPSLTRVTVPPANALPQRSYP